MAEHSKQQTKGGCRGRVQRHICVTGDTREQRPSRLRLEMPGRQSFSRLNCFESEPHPFEWVMRYMDGRGEDLWNQRRRVTDKRAEQFYIRGAIGAERASGFFERGFEDCGGSVVQRMCNRGWR